MSDLTGLGDFLERRREALQPEDVGLARGVRRRTAGLRREEVALLSHMSTDYYARLERGTGPTPSEQMLISLAQGLHLSLAERDHLFHLAGHQPPARHSGTEHISPGMLRVLDRLDDTPAEIVTELGETLRQSRLGVALLGDAALRTGWSRSFGYRWFADPSARAPYPSDEAATLSRVYAAGLRELVAARGPDSRAAELSDDFRARSPEFRAPVGHPRGRCPTARDQALPPPRGRPSRPVVPDPARPRDLAPAARLHGAARERERRETAPAVGSRRIPRHPGLTSRHPHPVLTPRESPRSVASTAAQATHSGDSRISAGPRRG